MSCRNTGNFGNGGYIPPPPPMPSRPLYNQPQSPLRLRTGRSILNNSSIQYTPNQSYVGNGYPMNLSLGSSMGSWPLMQFTMNEGIPIPGYIPAPPSYFPVPCSRRQNAGTTLPNQTTGVDDSGTTDPRRNMSNPDGRGGATGGPMRLYEVNESVIQGQAGQGRNGLDESINLEQMGRPMASSTPTRQGQIINSTPECSDISANQNVSLAPSAPNCTGPGSEAGNNSMPQNVNSRDGNQGQTYNNIQNITNEILANPGFSLALFNAIRGVIRSVLISSMAGLLNQMVPNFIRQYLNQNAAAMSGRGSGLGGRPGSPCPTANVSSTPQGSNGMQNQTMFINSSMNPYTTAGPNDPSLRNSTNNNSSQFLSSLPPYASMCSSAGPNNSYQSNSMANNRLIDSSSSNASNPNSFPGCASLRSNNSNSMGNPQIPNQSVISNSAANSNSLGNYNGNLFGHTYSTNSYTNSEPSPCCMQSTGGASDASRSFLPMNSTMGHIQGNPLQDTLNSTINPLTNIRGDPFGSLNSCTTANTTESSFPSFSPNNTLERLMDDMQDPNTSVMDQWLQPMEPDVPEAGGFKQFYRELTANLRQNAVYCTPRPNPCVPNDPCNCVNCACDAQDTRACQQARGSNN